MEAHNGIYTEDTVQILFVPFVLLITLQIHVISEVQCTCLYNFSVLSVQYFPMTKKKNNKRPLGLDGHMST